jgi:hypothetical protein
VDPGHGGDDDGTKRKWQGRTWYEKQFTLGLAVELITQIQEKGGTVVSTVIIPKDPPYTWFGANRIPEHGAEHFNLKGSPPIEGGIPGLSRRLEIGRNVLNRFPDAEVQWISVHFDFVRVGKGKEPISGTRIIYSADGQETTYVRVPRIRRQRRAMVDSIVAIEPPAFARDLAHAFTDAGWLRDWANRPVVASGKRGLKKLFVLRGENDPKIVGRRKSRTRYYNRVIDRVLIEYANFKSDEDWERLQQSEGSLRRLAAITVHGLVLHAGRDSILHTRGP